MKRGLGVSEDAALQFEAALGVGRKLRPVLSAVDGQSPSAGAEVALGIDMQPDRLEHRIVEKAAQERQSDVFVTIVDAAQRRRFALIVDHVSEVVQQRGDDQRGIRAGLLGQLRRIAMRAAAG